ncbi:MAG: ABC transporter permease subunit [Sciscionella sp.]
MITRDLAARRPVAVALTAVLVVFTAGALGAGAGLGASIDTLTRHFPPALTAIIGGSAPGGYVVSELFNLIAPVALVGYAIATGAAATAEEERSGTMALLAAQPVTRAGLLAGKVLGLLGTVIGVLTVFGAVALGAATLLGTGLTAGNIAATCLHLLLLAGFFGTLALALGAATGEARAAATAAGGLAALSYLANAMLPLAGRSGWAVLSPWHYYASSTPLAHGVDPAHLAVLAGLSAVALIVAFASFARRDLKG